MQGYRGESVAIGKDWKAITDWAAIRQRGTGVFGGTTRGWYSCVAISAGTAVIKRRNPAMLASAGGSVVLTKDWAHYLLQRMGYVK